MLYFWTNSILNNRLFTVVKQAVLAQIQQQQQRHTQSTYCSLFVIMGLFSYFLIPNHTTAKCNVESIQESHFFQSPKEIFWVQFKLKLTSINNVCLIMILVIKKSQKQYKKLALLFSLSLSLSLGIMNQNVSYLLR